MSSFIASAVRTHTYFYKLYIPIEVIIDRDEKPVGLSEIISISVGLGRLTSALPVPSVATSRTKCSHRTGRDFRSGVVS